MTVMSCTPTYQAARVDAGELVVGIFDLADARFLALEVLDAWQDAPADASAALTFTVEVQTGEASDRTPEWVPLHLEDGTPAALVMTVGAPAAVGLDAVAVALAAYTSCRFVADVAPDGSRRVGLHLAR